jgi:F0F1-type ATP synthase epsilon subunit
MPQNVSDIIKTATHLELLNVRVLTPSQFLFNGQALSVSSINATGKFDILPQHANFITLIENQTITIQKPDRKSINFQFHQAIIYAARNEVSIYAEPTQS